MKNSERKLKKQSKYIINTTYFFERKYSKLYKTRHDIFGNQFEEIIRTLSVNPFYNSLNTHKIIFSKYKFVYSSRITRDLRVIWDFDKKRNSICLLDIGGHSGKTSVYKR